MSTFAAAPHESTACNKHLIRLVEGSWPTSTTDGPLVIAHLAGGGQVAAAAHRHAPPCSFASSRLSWAESRSIKCHQVHKNGAPATSETESGANEMIEGSHKVNCGRK